MYIFPTEAGDFSIVPQGGRWHTLFRGEILGSYDSPQQAAFDVSVGHTFPTPDGVEPGKLGISKDISKWQTA
ncbi:MAG: hypothetical protein WCL27_18630 [Betaproteobacteria bacterium]